MRPRGYCMPAKGIVRMTKADWEARGTKLFGPDQLKWRFVCPACGNVAAVEDYKPFKAKGAQPDSATHNCIGRYDGHDAVPMGTAKPCNYTGYGLFNLCPVWIMDGDKEIRCFAFDERVEKAPGVAQRVLELIMANSVSSDPGATLFPT